MSTARTLLRARDAVKCSWWGRILSEHDTEPTELAGAAIMIALGILMMMPFDTLARSPVLIVLGPSLEWVWGLLLTTLGLLHLSALRTGAVTSRRLFSLLGFLVWFSFGMVFLWRAPGAVGGVLFSAAALGQCWVSVRLSRR